MIHFLPFPPPPSPPAEVVTRPERIQPLDLREAVEQAASRLRSFQKPTTTPALAGKIAKPLCRGWARRLLPWPDDRSRPAPLPAMNTETTDTNVPLCPSVQADADGSRIIGVVGGTPLQPRVAYLSEPLPPTDEILALTSPLKPTAVLRLTAPCSTDACVHFDGNDCRLVRRIVATLPQVSEHLPPCAIRDQCRWWSQQGRTACLRCPQIVTDNDYADETMATVAQPVEP